MDEDKDEETVEHLRCHISKLENFFFCLFNKTFFNLFTVVVIVKQINT